MYVGALLIITQLSYPILSLRERGRGGGGGGVTVKCDVKSSKQFYSQNNEHICPIKFLLERKPGRTCVFF